MRVLEGVRDTYIIMMAKLIFISYFVACFISAARSTDSKHEKRLILHSETDIAGELVKLQQEFAALQKELWTQKNDTIMSQKEFQTQRNNTIIIQREFAALQNELKTQKNNTILIQNELTKQTNITATLQQEMEKRLQSQMIDLEAQKNITTSLNKQLQTYQQALSQGSGSVYIRWGRNVCPSAASLVYKGYTAGKHYNRGGSGTNSLCLPSDPTWSKYQAGGSSLRGYIYGTEIDTYDIHHIFNYPVNQQDMPCAVCQSNKTSTMMIPARNNCYSDWIMEYHGYLMTGGDTQQASDYICMDENPEFLQHGGTNDDQHILYLVEGVCGSLPCPPYVNERELACVVCSK